MRLWVLLAGLMIFVGAAQADPTPQSQETFDDPFRQLDEVWPTPNQYRTATGAPGHAYWQQQVDYQITASLDNETQRLSGEEVITYTNNSPDELPYLWLQLDQNRFAPDSVSARGGRQWEDERMPFQTARELIARSKDGSFQIESVTDLAGNDLEVVQVDTHMRVNLSRPLSPGQKVSFKVVWTYQIFEAAVDTRGGYEYFKDQDLYLYTIAQWFPRLAAYTDNDGWTLKPYIDASEFALDFGDYQVSLTVPANHIVAATGELVNAGEVLSQAQIERLAEAKTAQQPVMIVTEDEVASNEDNKTSETKTWVFEAKNVRDFAFASSAKLLWDAQGLEQEDGPTVMAMSFYPKEANPLWGQYATHAIMHTLEVFSRHTFPYPYPTAQAVNADLAGMEYPMISFNGGRPDIDEETGEVSYSREMKYDTISVIIHETGHFYFPMIINSNERRWGWMDEGLDTFLQYLAESEWEENYPFYRGDPSEFAETMLELEQVPIMTNPDAVYHLGDNAYGKPAVALSVLREVVMGRELFDEAFREYARRWAFKRPAPADFFRTMEDASGMDLDWFWRAWFYGNDYVDVSIDKVTRFTIDTRDPDVERPLENEAEEEKGATLTTKRNTDKTYRVDRFPELKDFYNENNEYTVSNVDRNEYQDMLEGLEDWEKELLNRKENFYRIDLTNVGGMPTPVIMEITYVEGENERMVLPAEIWRYGTGDVSKFLITDNLISSIILDPDLGTADANTSNNYYPRKIHKGKIELYQAAEEPRNLMRDIREELTEEAPTEEQP